MYEPHFTAAKLLSWNVEWFGRGIDPCTGFTIPFAVSGDLGNVGLFIMDLRTLFLSMSRALLGRRLRLGHLGSIRHSLVPSLVIRR